MADKTQAERHKLDVFRNLANFIIDSEEKAPGVTARTIESAVRYPQYIEALKAVRDGDPLIPFAIQMMQNKLGYLSNRGVLWHHQGEFGVKNPALTEYENKHHVWLGQDLKSNLPWTKDQLDAQSKTKGPLTSAFNQPSESRQQLLNLLTAGREIGTLDSGERITVRNYIESDLIPYGRTLSNSSRVDSKLVDAAKKLCDELEVRSGSGMEIAIANAVTSLLPTSVAAPGMAATPAVAARP